MGYSMVDHLSTTGLDQKYNTFKLSDGSLIGCIIYDTNGTDRYRLLNETYFKKVDGCLLVYDITNRRSFEQIKDYFIPAIKEKCKRNIYTLLLGNKSDMADKRKISFEEGYELAAENNFRFKEASCFENKNVSESFQSIIENTYYEKKNNWSILDDSITLNTNRHINLNNKRKKCC